jgi:mannobiose 2-epimerase
VFLKINVTWNMQLMHGISSQTGCTISNSEAFSGVLTIRENRLIPANSSIALGFALYGLSEYHRATGDAQALEHAIALFESIQEHSCDKIYSGYIEATARDWTEIRDVRLSAKDANERKT